MERIEKRVGNTTIIVELNITVQEDKPRIKVKDGEVVVAKGRRPSPMKGRKYPKTECKVCGAVIGTNRYKLHMGTHGIEVPYSSKTSPSNRNKLKEKKCASK